MDKNKVIAVVLGGPGAEREVSLSTGAGIIKALKEKGYNVVEIDFDPKNFCKQLADAKADVVFNAMHGIYGEDGRIQSVLEMLDIPYTGSGVSASAIGMDKFATKRVLFGSGISTPDCLFLYAEDKAIAVEKTLAKFSLPVVVKPASQGSSLGITIVRKEEELQAAFNLAFEYCDEVLVEECIIGDEITVSMVKSGGKLEIFPIILIKANLEWYDFKAKYSAGGSEHIIPAPLDTLVEAEAKKLATDTFNAIGCNGVARVDIMIDQLGKCYVLEINTVPGMTPTSLVPDAAAALGISYADLCEIILQDPLKSK